MAIPQLVAVSKGQSAAKIRAAYNCGQRDFAENYLQEALAKQEQLADLDIAWHFIGALQSNKTGAIAERFQWVHSVDRLRIARRLSEQRPAAAPPLKVLLQVNISAESSKSGIRLEDVEALAQAVDPLPGIDLAGLMGIAAPSLDFAQQRGSFRLLAQARDLLRQKGFARCRHLSMGMSQDYEAAIAEGATILRLGTGIFGERS